MYAICTKTEETETLKAGYLTNYSLLVNVPTQQQKNLAEKLKYNSMKHFLTVGFNAYTI